MLFRFFFESISLCEIQRRVRESCRIKNLMIFSISTFQVSLFRSLFSLSFPSPVFSPFLAIAGVVWSSLYMGWGVGREVPVDVRVH